MYKWHIKLLFKNGVIQWGYHESIYSSSNDVFNELMLVGEPITGGSFRTIYTDDTKKNSLSYNVSEVSSIIISA